jgi:beta-barrel assembly-enhancing protease
MATRFFIFIVLTLNLSLGSAQIDFNNYRTLEASGPIPKELTSKVYEEIDRRIKDKTAPYTNDLDTRAYLDWSMYAVDRLLNSGFTVYGDPISKYVRSLVGVLLSDQASIRDSMRYFTVKSDVPIVFVSDQGAVFTSTGLISRLENDAQLSFLLAHALAHYIEKHQLEKFYWSGVQEDRFDWVRNFHVYREDDEHKADELALQMYLRSGFAESQIELVFEFLKHAHLPFEEIPIATSFFSTDRMYVPENIVPVKPYLIKENTRSDDNNGPFPFLAERIEKRTGDLSKDSLRSVGRKFLNSNDQFIEMRNICRFETMRTLLISGKYAQTLYAIHVLEQDFPNSKYLEKMKAHCWLEMYQYEKLDLRKKIMPSKNSFEGESGKFYQLIGEMNERGWQAFAMRTIYDLYKDDSNDPENKALYKCLIKEVASDGNFKTEDYALKSFTEVSAAVKSGDTLALNSEIKTNSKYDKIRKGKDPHVTKSFDSTKYYLYGVYDIMQDEDFLSEYRKEKRDHYDQMRMQDTLKMKKELSSKKQLEKDLEKMHFGINRFTVIEPEIRSISRGVIDNVRSEYLKSTFVGAFEIASELSGTQLTILSSERLTSDGTVLFNQMNTLRARNEQIIKDVRVNSVPLDFTVIQALSSQTGSTKVILPVVVSSFDPDFSKEFIISAAILFPVAIATFPIYFPIKLLNGYQTSVRFLILDTETGEMIYRDAHTIRMPLNTNNLAGHLYEYLRHFSIQPAN